MGNRRRKRERAKRRAYKAMGGEAQAQRRLRYNASTQMIQIDDPRKPDDDPPIYFTTAPAPTAFRDLAAGLREIMERDGFAPRMALVSAQTFAALEAELARRPRTERDDRVDALTHAMRHTGASRSQVDAALTTFENANSAPLSTARDLQTLSRKFTPRK